MAKKWDTRSRIIPMLRRVFLFFPVRYSVLAKSRIRKNGKYYYKCAITKKYFLKQDIVVDHIEPVIDPKIGWVDWNTYIDRLFCDASNLQVLSKEAHKQKTQGENRGREKKRQPKK